MIGPNDLSLIQNNWSFSNLKGNYDEVNNKPVFISILDILCMLHISYSKYSGRKNPHMMSSSDNRISGNALYVVYIHR